MQKAFKFFATAIVISLLPIAIHFYGDNRITLPAKHDEHWLLLIAHPDDESMFFGPTLLFLSSIGVHVHLLCVTAGNSEGLGTLRLSELYSAASVYGIHAKHVHFVDPEEQTFRDGFFDWNVTSLSASIYAHIKRSRPNGLITFDEWGISGHPNHISCFRAIHNLKGEGKLNELGVKKTLALKSVGIWRKYIGFADLLTICCETLEKEQFVTYMTNPLRIYEAMLRHRSQLLWFRYIYMALSRYVYVNIFVPLT